jgi:hypothetical protein
MQTGDGIDLISFLPYTAKIMANTFIERALEDYLEFKGLESIPDSEIYLGSCAGNIDETVATENSPLPPKAGTTVIINDLVTP